MTYNITKDWTELPFTEGSIQNLSRVDSLELTNDITSEGFVIPANSEFNWKDSTVFVRSLGNPISIRILPFSSAGGTSKAEQSLLQSSADRISRLEKYHNELIDKGTDINPVYINTSGEFVQCKYPVTDGSIDASKIISGTIDIARLPKAALERVIMVDNTQKRLALTIEDIQNGDTVKELDTGKLFFVVDDSQLGTEKGFTPYTTNVEISSNTATSCSGNAATATKLQTKITLFGTPFDGSTNVSVLPEVTGNGLSAHQNVKINAQGQLIAGDLVKICRCTDDINADKDLLVEAEIGTKEIFANWQRISCEASNGSNQNASTSAQVASRQAYDYNQTYDAIICKENSDPFSAFISGEEFEPDYRVKYMIDNRILNNLGLIDNDDDGLVFICGYMVDSNNKFHTLSVWRIGSTDGSHGCRFAICYDNYTSWIKNRTAGTGLTLASTSSLTASNWGASVYATCEVTKTPTQIIAKTTNVKSESWAQTLTFTLPTTKPSNWTQEQYDNIKYMMENNSRIGFGTESNRSAFKILEMAGSIGRTTVFDMDSCKVLKFENGKQVSAQVATDMAFVPGSFYYSSLNGKFFYCKSVNEVIRIH